VNGSSQNDQKKKKRVTEKRGEKKGSPKAKRMVVIVKKALKGGGGKWVAPNVRGKKREKSLRGDQTKKKATVGFRKTGRKQHVTKRKR